MGQLEAMQIFVRVVEAGTITLAAEQLKLAKSAVSKRLAELESQLGTKLINRTTRTSSLTEAGHDYYRHAKQILEEVDELNHRVTSSTQTLKGRLKISIPLSFGLNHLIPLLDQFLQQHPQLELETNFSDHKVDLVEEGFDLAFRIGKLDDSSLQARKIVTIRHVFCASPDYLNKYGTPKDLAELTEHRYLKYGQQSTVSIPVQLANGSTQVLQLKPYTSANNGEFLQELALSGHGFCFLPTFLVWKQLQAKQLLSLFPEVSFPLMHGYAIYPANRYLPAKVRALIDFLVQSFGDPPYWDQA